MINLSLLVIGLYILISILFIISSGFRPIVDQETKTILDYTFSPKLGLLDWVSLNVVYLKKSIALLIFYIIVHRYHIARFKDVIPDDKEWIVYMSLLISGALVFAFV